jgi:hypothetical protein
VPSAENEGWTPLKGAVTWSRPITRRSHCFQPTAHRANPALWTSHCLTCACGSRTGGLIFTVHDDHCQLPSGENRSLSPEALISFPYSSDQTETSSHATDSEPSAEKDSSTSIRYLAARPAGRRCRVPKGSTLHTPLVSHRGKGDERSIDPVHFKCDASYM